MNHNGFIVLYKEKGITSFEAVNRLRKILGAKKCGHTGTLDPLAEGVLPVCVNSATKLIKYLNENEKEYIAEFQLGIATDTFDITGRIIEKSDEVNIDRKRLLAALNEMRGEITLPVPRFSAVKINGKRAYKLARENKDFDAGNRVSVIYDVQLLDYKENVGLVKIVCSKGTYIRSFVDELGRKLKVYATMTNLIRTKSGDFVIKDAVRLDMIEEMVKNNDFSFFIPVRDILNFPKVVVKDEFLKLAKNGGRLKRNMYLTFPLDNYDKYYFLTDRYDNIFAIAKKEEGSVFPLKIEHVF